MSTIGIGFGAPIMPVAKTCACGQRYSALEWNRLPLLGVQHLIGSDRGEVRNCVCGSSLMRMMTGKPTVRMDAVTEKVLLEVEAAAGGRDV